MKYPVIYEKSRTGWAAYVPNLSGLGVAGRSFEEVETLIREGIGFHIEGMRKLRAKGQGPRANSQGPKVRAKDKKASS